MKILILFSFLIGSAIGKEKEVVVTAGAPACYQLPNTGVTTALRLLNAAAEEKCKGRAILKQMSASSTEIGGCRPVRLIGAYSCPDSENEL